VDAPTPVNKNPGTAASGRTVGGRYTLGATVGSGGMGTVWRAHDELLRRDVAVKEVLLPPGLPAPERALLCERTLREARAAAALNHPAVVRVYDVVQDGERPWIVMELLEARNISEVLRDDGPMPVRKVAEMGLAVLGALEAAHRVGVLHRDVKPGNVLLGADGRTTLTDFGVARSANESPLTSTGLLLGSPQYIAPERARGQAFGPSSDLWSLGATLYTAVEGRAPFDRGDPLPTMTAVVCEPPDPMSFAGALAPILDGLLEKTPDTRWDAARTRAALKTVLAGGSVSASPAAPSSNADQAPRQQRRRPESRTTGRPTPPPPAPPRSSRALENTGAMEGTAAWQAMQPDTGPSRPVSPPPPPTPQHRPPAPQRPVGREYGRPRGQEARQAPLAPPEATSLLPNSGPPRPTPAGPTAVYRRPGPTSPAAGPQPTSGLPGTPRRAAYLQSPDAMRASAAGETSPVPNPGRVVDTRQRRYVVFAVVAVLVVLVMGIGAYAIGAAFSDEKSTANTPTTQQPKPSSGFKLVAHQDDRGFTVDVPSGWEKKQPKGGVYVDYQNSTDERLRLLVERASSPKGALQAAMGVQRKQEREGNISDFKSIRMESTDKQLGGQETWEWEWTYTKDGQARHVLWRTTVVDKKSYGVYYSAPDQGFDAKRALFDQISASFRFDS
jgi:serine/threonine protein kinase